MRLVFGVLALVPLVVAAETAYVTDTLQLGMHQAQDTSDRPFRSLDSGQQMEVLSRTRYYAHVRLPDGTQGYVKAGFLVDSKPAKLIVAETQAEVDRLARELAEAREAFAAPAATIDTLKQQAA
ncbi:MAG: TIGR04211 family SH3 domain-containing protein, partial [Gammaproteobacteria bacterium]|nr:TIGR04211 family SH3 domain-containing protein [Gammaproteobacteria bacterium]